jgi:hypothetical protein
MYFENRIYISQLHWQPFCRLCHKPVPLENSNTDEDGKAVHQECYVAALSRRPATSPERVRGQVLPRRLA